MHNKDEIDSILSSNGLTETELIFKENVKKLRKRSGFTITQTAIALGLKYGKYRLIESLTPVNVKFETIERIAKYYGIPVSDLFKL